jgi:hypothetical protein
VKRGVLLLALLWGGAARAQSPQSSRTPTIRLDDLGPGPGPKTLARAVALPHSVVPPASTPATLRRDSIYQHTVIVLGRDVTVLASVHGDVIVVGGNLFLRPGAAITGRAIAIGGGVYESTLAIVGGGMTAYRDFTYDIAPIAGGFSLRYRSFVDVATPTFSLPGLYGLRVPSYDRTNGLSAPFSPRVSLRRDAIVAEPRITYRSQLGVLDPSGTVVADVADAVTLRLSGGRGTFTNEEWIWHDLINSAATLIGGDDARNYWRATRGTATIERRWDWRSSSVVPFIGGLWESARDARPDSNALGGPWSFRDRRDRDDMLRPNPPIDEGTIGSLLFGGRLEWADDQGMEARLGLAGEWGHLSPIGSLADSVASTFAQTTLDGSLSFPTFGAQSLRLEGHALVTFTSHAPRQRWGYVGGAASLPTIETLSRGGDQLLFLDGRYNVPIERWAVPILGAPTISLREILAGADVDRFPALAQATGVRAALSILYLEFLVDPAHRHGILSAGLSIDR